MIKAASEHTKHVVDGLSVFTVLGTLVDVLPSLAALFTLVWTLIRIYETKTVQDWLAKRRKK
jgi:hypothetical protein